MVKNLNLKKRKKEISILKSFLNNFYMLMLSFKASPIRVVGEFGREICQQLGNLYFGIIFWEVVLQFVEKEVSFKEVIPFLFFSVVLVFFLQLVTVLNWCIIEPIGNQRLYEKMHIRMLKKACDVELECFENPDFYNKYMKAVTQIKSRAHTVLWTMSGLLVSLLSLTYLFYKTIALDPFAVLFAVFPMISTYVVGKKINEVNYELYQKNIFEDRKKEYVKRSIYQKQYAKELRLSNGFTFLMHYFHKAVNAVIQNTKKYGMKVGILSCFSEGLSQVFVTAGSILYASVRLLYFKDLQVSEYIVLINAITAISNNLVADAQFLTRIQDNYLYIQNIRGFFDYEPKIAQSQKGKSVPKEEIVLKMENVSFSYFGQDKEVLKDINISINKNEKIVLVGENGAGKTTLVKLLMRLYDPTKGCLTLNGSNVRDYAVSEYRDLFGTVFQDFKIFSVTVAENVLMCRMKEEDRQTVEDALKSSGVYDKVMTLPNGIETILTREFDSEGAVLSGGEQQKIAIARVFAKDCEIAILDEPSSALDPIAEYQMYESMLKACENKAVVFISHRLSSAVLADKIYMLEHGRIIESGSHEELMKLNGKYAEMFRLQAGNYVGRYRNEEEKRQTEFEESAL